MHVSGAFLGYPTTYERFAFTAPRPPTTSSPRLPLNPMACTAMCFSTSRCLHDRFIISTVPLFLFRLGFLLRQGRSLRDFIAKDPAAADSHENTQPGAKLNPLMYCVPGACGVIFVLSTVFLLPQVGPSMP